MFLRKSAGDSVSISRIHGADPEIKRDDIPNFELPGPRRGRGLRPTSSSSPETRQDRRYFPRVLFNEANGLGNFDGTPSNEQMKIIVIQDH